VRRGTERTHSQSPNHHEMQREVDNFDRHIFFFYSAVPLCLSAVSIFETWSLWRRNTLRPMLFILSAGAGLILWVLQLGLESMCTWASSSNHDDGPTWHESHCPYAFSNWNDSSSMSSWGTGLALAWVLPWIVLGQIVL
jgi:hypothetical protein